jgi:hypothetical protein
VADLYIALVHYPVLDRTGRVITSAITSLDIHDLARSARTYDVRSFFVIHPIPEQRDFAQRVIEHWSEYPGREFDSRRREALDLVEVIDNLDMALDAVFAQSGEPPLIAATSARSIGSSVYSKIRTRLEVSGGPPILLLFGTGFGLAPAILERADIVLAPVYGPGNYNHLSVRAAAAIILDRLKGR